MAEENPIKFSDLFDFSDDKEVMKAINAINGLSDVYEKFIDGTKKLKADYGHSVKTIVDKTAELEDQIDKLNPKTDAGRESISRVAKEVDVAAESYDAVNKKVKALEGTIGQLTKEQDSFNKKAEETNKLNQEREKLSARLGQLEGAEADEVAKLRLAIQEKNKELKESAKESLGLVSLYQKESKRLRDLKNQYKDAALAYGKNSKEAQKLGNEANELDKKLKNLDKSVGDNHREVGSYKESIKGAASEQQLFGTSLKDIIGKFSSVTGVIGAVVGGVVALAQAYLSSGRGARFLLRAQDRLSTASERLGNKLADMMGDDGKENIFDRAMTSVSVMVQGVAETAIQDMINKIKESVRDTQKSIEAQAIAQKTLLQQAEQMRQIRDEERNSLEERERANADLITVINARESQRVALLNRQIENVKTLLEFNKDSTELEKLLISLQLEKQDIQEESEGFRSEALMNDLALAREQSEQEIAVLEAQLAYEKTIREEGSRELFHLEIDILKKRLAAELIAIGDNEDKKKAAILKAKAERQKLLDDYLPDPKAKGLGVLEVRIPKALEKAKVRAVDLKDTWIGAMMEMNEEMLNFVDGLQTWGNQFGDLFEAVGARRDQQDQRRIQGLEKQKEKELALAGDNAQKKEEIEAEYDRKIQALERRQVQRQRQIALFQKAIGISTAVIETAVAVNKALANPPGPPFSIPQALAAGAFGALRVATIAAQPIPQYAKGTQGKAHGGGWAVVGDGGQRELIMEPSGRIRLSDDKPQLVDLPGGSHVLNGAITEGLLSSAKSYRESNDSASRMLEKVSRQERRALMGEGVMTFFQKENDVLAESFKDAISNLPEIH